MSQDQAPHPTQRAPLYAAALALSTLTTVAAVIAYLFFRSIDDANVARAEANGFDPTQLTPHGDLLWLLLTTAVPASVALTAGLLIALVASLRPARRGPVHGPQRHAPARDQQDPPTVSRRLTRVYSAPGLREGGRS